MKKVILFSLMMFSGFFLSQNIAQDSGNEGPGLEEPCKETIETNGSIITVTVCDRSTDWIGYFNKTLCNVVASSQCSFTNVGLN